MGSSSSSSSSSSSMKTKLLVLRWSVVTSLVLVNLSLRLWVDYDTASRSRNNISNRDNRDDQQVGERGAPSYFHEWVLLAGSILVPFGVWMFLVTHTTNIRSAAAAAAAARTATKTAMIYVLVVIIVIAAAMAMHFPGWICQFRYHGGYHDPASLVATLVGSITEGTFLLVLWSNCSRSSHHYCHRANLWKRKRIFDKKAAQAADEHNGNGANYEYHHWYNSQSLYCYWHSLLRLLSIILSILLLASIVLCFVGDATYQDMTGGVRPDMWTINSGLRDVTPYLQDVFRSDRKGSLERIALTCACLGTSIVLYEVAMIMTMIGQQTKQQQQQGLLLVDDMNCPSNSSNATSTTTTSNNNIDTTPAKGSSTPGCCTAARCQDFLQQQHMLLAVTGIVSLLAYAGGAFCPVLHAYMSFFGSFVLVPEGANIGIASASATATGTRTGRPNVIYLIHDSLASTYLYNDKDGQRATPFFQSLLHADDDNRWLYPLRNVRSVSGDTIEGFTALASGCLPLPDGTGRDIAFSRSIGTEYKKQGYRTASFTSAPADLQGTTWFMMENYIKANMDLVVEPVSSNHDRINEGSADDRLLLPHFERWLRKHNVANKKSSSSSSIPFYAQFYLLNTHWPYDVTSDFKFEQADPYFQSLELFDETLKGLFETLKKTGHSNDTIIVASGDHGEYPFKGGNRVRFVNPVILNPLAYLYVPPHFMTQEELEVLRENCYKTVSTLDIFPTLQHILYGGSATETASARKDSLAANVTSHDDLQNCITGLDLMGTRIHEDRLAVSWNTLTSSGRTHAALSGSKYGLYRKVMRGNNEIKKVEGEIRSSFCQMDFGNIATANYSSGPCLEELSDDERNHWQSIIENMNATSHASQALIQSALIDMLRTELLAKEV